MDNFNRLEHLKRCDAEISSIASHPDITKPGSAILSTMGQLDWSIEKDLIYKEFLNSKQIRFEYSGITVDDSELHPKLKSFQRAVLRWSLAKGRSALFEGCGLGKTFQQLEWSRVVSEHACRVLILAPLMVVEQTANEESVLWQIPVTLCESMSDVAEGINITNYEKLHKFEPEFSGIVLDESSILKSFNGKTRNQLVEFASGIPYRLCCTATPAPNDYMEFGNHAEFLGVMRAEEMLATFFCHDGGDTSKWRLKGHAKDAFWRWLASWSMFFESPQDIGFEEPGYVLPPLEIYEVLTGSEYVGVANTLSERREARRESIDERVHECAELVKRINPEQTIVWCDLNAEADAIASTLESCVGIHGSTPNDKRSHLISSFLSGKHRNLVSKPSVCGFGMNLQVCSVVLFVGLSDSWESMYQAIRRCWRFGQTMTVTVYIIIAYAEGKVLENIKRKEEQAKEMRRQMVRYMRELTIQNLSAVERVSDMYETEKQTGNTWTALLGDSVEHLSHVPDNSIHYAIYSPPFSSLYTYNNSLRDLGNTRSYEEFMIHYEFITRELYRVLAPGRLTSIHCMLLPASKQFDGFIGLKDFRGDIIRVHERSGFVFHSEVVIWKNPVTAMQRTKALGLLHKQLTKDSCMSRQGIPDYVVTMRKVGINEKPVSGLLSRYFGEENDKEFQARMYSLYKQRSKGERDMDFYTFVSINIWQRYASPVWMDINSSYTLQRESARDDEDERHICPLQLQVIERLIQLWTLEGDTVLDPFAGIGSTGYVATRLQRESILMELKRSYYDQLVLNMKRAERDALIAESLRSTPE